MSAPGGGRATVAAPANIAFVKYWGARDRARALPENPSISMTLKRCVSTTTAELRPPGEEDEVLVREPEGRLAPAPEAFAAPVRRHLDTLRRALSREEAFRIATANSFPTGAGMASSASGFAALTLAVTRALGLELPAKRLSNLARRSGSGSAARSVLGGYVEWPAGDSEEEAYAVPLAPAEQWDLRDLIAVVETDHKEVGSREGHQRARTSPHFETRLALLPERLERVRAAIAGRDLAALGPVLEEEAVELHLIAMSSRPPIYYWAPATLAVLEAVRSLRAVGIGAWATMDAGANVHVLCEGDEEDAVASSLKAVPGVRSVLRDGVGPGPSFDAEPLL